MSLLKLMLISQPFLTLLKTTDYKTLHTDACDVLVGCLILQQQPDVTTNPIGYWSRSLSDAERKYDTTSQICLAIVCVVLLLRFYSGGIRFTIRTEHDFLKWFFNLTNSTERLARGWFWHSEIKLDAIHRASVTHQGTDALFCLKTTVKTTRHSRMNCFYSPPMHKTDKVVYSSLALRATKPSC